MHAHARLLNTHMGRKNEVRSSNAHMVCVCGYNKLNKTVTNFTFSNSSELSAVQHLIVVNPLNCLNCVGTNKTLAISTRAARKVTSLHNS